MDSEVESSESYISDFDNVPEILKFSEKLPNRITQQAVPQSKIFDFDDSEEEDNDLSMELSAIIDRVLPAEGRSKNVQFYDKNHVTFLT